MKPLNQPALRFAGFADAWEQRKLGECVQFYSGLTYSPSDVVTSGGTLVLRSSNVQDGKISLTDNVYVKTDVVNCANVEVGDIIVVVRNGSRNLIGKHTIIKSKMPSTVIGAFMTGVKNQQPDFCNTLFDGNQFISEINKNLGATINQITISAFKQMLFFMPSPPEQTAIGDFFRQLDEAIASHQRKLEKIKELKNSLLHKMFPKDGETVPELRLSGFTDAWEWAKFSELAKIQRGLTYKPTDVQAYGVRVLRSSNIIEDKFFLRKDDIFVNPAAINIDFIKNGDILITSANGSSQLVGKHAIINNVNENIVHGGFMLLARADKPDFVQALMNAQWYQKFINIFVSGGNGAIGNLSKSDLEDQIVLIPTIEEQTAIGNFFRQLDTVIEAYQQKSNQLHTLKTALLGKMFV